MFRIVSELQRHVKSLPLERTDCHSLSHSSESLLGAKMTGESLPLIVQSKWYEVKIDRPGTGANGERFYRMQVECH